MKAVDHHRVMSDAQRFAILKERCALVGVELRESTNDRGRPLYVAQKWALTKQLETLEALAAWVAMVDGKAE